MTKLERIRKEIELYCGKDCSSPASTVMKILRIVDEPDSPSVGEIWRMKSTPDFMVRIVSVGDRVRYNLDPNHGLCPAYDTAYDTLDGFIRRYEKV